MKGNISNWFKSEEKRPQRRVISWVLVVVLIIVILLLLLRQCSFAMQETSETSDEASAHDSILPTIYFNGNDGYSNGGKDSKSDGMKLQAVSGLVFEHGKETHGVTFSNAKDNLFAFKLSLYLADGTLLFESGYINPGCKIDHIELTKSLKVGLYSKALMVYRVYSTDDTRSEISQCEFPIEIRVQ